MVHPAELAKRDSDASTATFNSLASNGSMASAAMFSRGRRMDAALKSKTSQPSIRSVDSSSSDDSLREANRHSASKKNTSSPRRSDSPLRMSLGSYVERARGHRADGTGQTVTTSSSHSNGNGTNQKRSRQTSNSHQHNHAKAKRRSAETVMQSGRHGNEWLFNGWSLRETVKGLLK